jgi:membrane protease YdiL (CAAX protease family)
VSNLPPYEPHEPDEVRPPVWRVGRYPDDLYEPVAPPTADYAESEVPQSPVMAAAEAEPAIVRRSDPSFGFIVAVALSVGLMPLVPENTDIRYIVVWGILTLFGVTAWLFGRGSRIERETPENLGWGIAFGVLIGFPLLAVGAEPLSTMAHLLFRAAIDGAVRPLSSGSVLALLVFVQPLAETLFFRGLAQDHRPFWFVGGIATLWSVLLYFPLLDIGRYPLVAVVIAVALLMMNLVYSYVRRRNGLAAAWLCQIVLNFILLFIPYVTG